MAGVLLCPICREALERSGTSLRCASGHSYDVARSGYVNLLPPGRKSNARSGDPDGMVRARREFLAGGYYDEYVRRVAGIAMDSLGGKCGVTVDAACGEGHHSLILGDEVKPDMLIGLDASKKAADTAAKAAKRRESPTEFRFTAGNIFAMPVRDRSCDLVTVLFAPIPDREAYRVLRSGGVLCTAGAGADHLIELRRMIYDEVRIKDSGAAEFDGFRTEVRENIKYTVDLDGDALRALFAMTPFCHRASSAAKEKIASSDGLKVTVSVDCTIYRKEIENEDLGLHTDVQ